MALAASPGCAKLKLLRLENEVLVNQNRDLRAELGDCRADAPPPDYATHVDLDVIREYISRVGLPTPTVAPTGVMTLPVKGKNTEFQLTVQLFAKEKVLYLSVVDYLSLEQATSSPSMVLLLTQLAAINYEMLLGKLQLNPRSGAISLSMEVQIDDGLGYRTFEAVLNHLITSADQRYPELLRAAQGRGI